MKAILLTQRSPEWHAWRNGNDLLGIPRITATAASVISGLNPYQTPTDLWLEMKGLKPARVVTPAMQRGVDLEDAALAAYNRMTGLASQPTCVEHATHGWAGASLDGVDAFDTRLVEIKCPGARTHALALDGSLPEHYWAQIQWQLFCADFVEGDYFSFDGESGAPPLVVSRDDNFLATLFEQAKRFRQSLIDDIPPAGVDREELAEAYLAAHIEATAIIRKRDELATALKALAVITKAPFSTRSGVAVTSVNGRRIVDYKALLASHKITATHVKPFTKQGTPTWRVDLAPELVAHSDGSALGS